MATAAQAAPRGGAVTSLPVRAIAPGGTNPRRHFDAEAMRELVTSVKAHGVLQPVLVRPWPGSPRRLPAGSLTLAGGEFYELIAGERRWRAAKEAGLEEIPALVREMTDDQVLEIQVVENLQRQDLHALEECDGYMRLRRAGYDVARIAERVGRSVAYVYDRLRLANLTDEARRVFSEGKIQAGHAVLLARLPPDMQELALSAHDGVFEVERTLFDPREITGPAHGVEPTKGGDALAGMKARTVKELQAWIDKHVRLDLEQTDLEQLFPEVAAAVDGADEPAEDDPRPVVQITQDHYVAPTARDGSRIIGPRSWKPATKPCEHLATGVIVVGPGRGEAFPVCVEKKKCRVHWGAEIRAHEKAVKAGEAAAAAGGKTGAAREDDRYAAEQKRYEEQQRKRKEAEAVWQRASSDILYAVAAAVADADLDVLGDLLMEAVAGWEWAKRGKAADKFLKRGSTAEQLVRHLALIELADHAGQYDAPAKFPKLAKKVLGLELKPIIAKHAAAPAPAEKKPKGKGRA